MQPELLLRALLRERRVTVEIISNLSLETIASRSTPPGEERLRLSDFFSLTDGEPDETLFQGSESLGWHTLYVPASCTAGEIYTPASRWEAFDRSSLFEPHTRRIRLNHPADPVLKGFLTRSLSTRITFCF